MKKISYLALLPVLAQLAGGCSGNSNFGDDTTGDTGTPADDGSIPLDDAGNPVGDANPKPPPSNTPLATGLTVTDITVLQGVEVYAVKGSAIATHNAPIVAGRKALVRAFVSPASAFSHPLTAVLTLTTSGQDHTFTASLTPKATSTDAAFSSTFNFSVDAASLGADTTFLVQVKDSQGTGTGDTTAQFPRSGTAASLGVETSGVVKISVFPIHFTQGGGTPATGALDINEYQSIVMGMYPSTAVQLTVQPTVNYSGSIPTASDSNGSWESLLSFMSQKRAADPATDVYYYGAFAPSSSFASFCNSGCVAGLSSVPGSPANFHQKVSIGLVYGGNPSDQQATAQTMAHEVGHGHGREHAPTTYTVQGCSTPGGVDTGYPYKNGGIGTWGYDIQTSQAVDPTQNFDIMGYCAYDWISDYTYKALFDWIAADNGADMIISKTPVTYRTIFVRPDNSLEVGDAYPVYGPVGGTPHTVTFEDNGVTRTVNGFYFPYDHVKGGYILAPEPPHFNSVRVGDFSKLAAPLQK